MRNDDTFWVVRFLYNLLGYGSVGVPMALFVWFVKTKKLYQSETEPRSWFGRLTRFFVYGTSLEKNSLEAGNTASVNPSSPDKSRDPLQNIPKLLLCFVGLQASYLTWGILQEKIMTRKYYSTTPSDANGDSFRDSQFIVFVNKLLGFCVATVYLCVAGRHYHHSSHNAPFYKYSYCALSNIVSSWCQYEALKFVSFPTQVLAKASKIIPVMLMGKIVSRKKYQSYEYFSAFLISLGMLLFLWAKPQEAVITAKSYVVSTTYSGFLILVAYLASDAFTSNWQGELFSQFKMTPMQMMCGVNFFSALLAFVPLLQTGALFESLQFLAAHRSFAFDCALQATCSVSGQLFVFFTISQFGPVVFVTMMTIRQAVAIILSCIIYGHSLGRFGVLGVIVVFFAMFFKMYQTRRSRKRRLSKSRTATTSPRKTANKDDRKPLLKVQSEIV